MRTTWKGLLVATISASILLLFASEANAYCDGTCESSPCWMLGKQASPNGSCDMWDGGTYCCISSGGGIGEGEAIIPQVFAVEAKTALEAADCFDYYRFGSVQAVIESGTDNAAAGSAMDFKVQILNRNDYPIVDGAVFVKIFRKQRDGDFAHRNGHNLVEQFFAAEKIWLDAGASKEIGFEWQVPANAVQGEYQIAAFYVSAKKFNLLGLSFTDDVVGNTFDFSVSGETKKGAYLNKNTVKVNGANYNFAAFTPKIPEGAAAKIEIELENESGTRKKIPVRWVLYRWDALREENIIESKEEIVYVDANKTKKLYYNATHSAEPVYLLVAEALDGKSKSILGIRFTRGAVDRARINFAGISKYPLAETAGNTVFACIHGMGTADVVKNGRLVLKLLDAAGSTIGEYEYAGDITGAVMGMKKDFNAGTDEVNLTLRAELYMGDKLVDYAELKYDCNQINPEKCRKRTPEEKPKQPAAAPVASSNGLTALAAILAAVLVLVLLYKWIKGKKITHCGIIVLIIFGGLVTVPEGAHAKTTSWDSTINDTLYYFWNEGGATPTGEGTGWAEGLRNPNISIRSGAKITNMDTGAILNEGTVVPVGTRLRFERIPPVNEDISWFGTGHSADSPFGRWSANAAPPAGASCGASDFVSSFISEYVYYDETGKPIDNSLHIDTYVILAVNPQTLSVSHSGSTAGLNCNTSQTECTVTSPGSVNTTFTFSGTTGKFYYRYLVTDIISDDPFIDDSASANLINRCTRNDIPMSIQPNGEFLKAGVVHAVPIRFSTNVNLYLEGTENSPPYILSVSQQQITYDLAALSPNSPPAVPIIAGPATGFTGTDYQFSFNSTDPDNDTIRYGVDWDNDGTENGYVGGTGYVASGETKTAAKSWPAKGPKTFRAFAEDSTGSKSGWSGFTINILEPLSADAWDYSAEKGIVFKLDGKASGGTETYIKWEWDLGTNPLECGFTDGAGRRDPDIRCMKTGTENINLRVTDSSSATATDKGRITITEPASCTITAPHSAKTGEEAGITIDYTGFGSDPLSAAPAEVFDCGENGTIKSTGCSNAANTPPISGQCTLICTYSTAGNKTVGAEISSDTQKAECGSREIIVTAPIVDTCTSGLSGTACKSSCGTDENTDWIDGTCNTDGGRTCCIAKPSVDISASPLSVSEKGPGNTSDITFSCTGISHGNISVQYTKSGGAQYGTDYTLTETTGSITIGCNATTEHQIITLTTMDNQVVGPPSKDATMEIQSSADPQNDPFIIGNPTATVTINDDDTPALTCQPPAGNCTLATQCPAGKQRINLTCSGGRICCGPKQNPGTPCDVGDYCRSSACIPPNEIPAGTLSHTPTCNDGSGGTICCSPMPLVIPKDLVSIEIATPSKAYGIGREITPLITVHRNGLNVGSVTFEVARIYPGETAKKIFRINLRDGTILPGAENAQFTSWPVSDMEAINCSNLGEPSRVCTRRIGKDGKFRVNTPSGPLNAGNYTLTATITEIWPESPSANCDGPNERKFTYLDGTVNCLLVDPITFNNTAGTFVSVGDLTTAVPEIPPAVAVLLVLAVVVVARAKAIKPKGCI